MPTQATMPGQTIGPGGGIHFEVSGVAALEQAFKLLGKAAQARVLRKAARAAGKIFLRAAIANAPVNKEYEKSVKAVRARAKKIGVANRKIFRRLAMESLRNQLIRQKQPAGTLKKHIKLRVSKFQKRGETFLIVMTGTRADMGIDASDPYYYPAAVEYGHGLAGEGGQRSKAVPPHPFMRPTFDSNKQLAKSTAEQILKTEIDAEAQKIGALGVAT